MQISVVIPNFNGKNLLDENLSKVIEAKLNKKNHILEIIIVDDASGDDSVSYLKQNFARKIRLIVHKKNRGFAASVNTGVRMAKGDLVCLLNSDVIPSRDFLQTMSENFEDSQVFAVSLHEKGGYGYTKGKFENGFIVHVGMPASNKVEDSFWASGGSAVFRRDLWMELKGMDEELMPFYFEDLDLSYRAQKRGYKVLWDPRANVIHEHESTYKKLNQKYISRMRERNYLLFNWKNLTSERLMAKHTIAIIKKVLFHPGYLRIVLMARSKWKELIEKRKIEQKETTVSDEAIFAKFN